MGSKPGKRGTDSGNPLQGRKWQKIQDLFAKIIGANMSLIDIEGNFVNEPSRVTSSCLEMTGVDCARQATSVCGHRFHYYSFKVENRNHPVSSLVLGPISVGKREDEIALRELSQALAIDPENFIDRAKEIRVISYAGIQTVTDFLRELTESFVRHSYQREELKRLLPRLISRALKPGRFFSTVYVSELTHSLLEVARALVGADSGSVLLVDQKEKCFFIKAARGLRAGIIEDSSQPMNGGVAEWVLSERRPVLIHKEAENGVLGTRLKRLEIQSSMVIPMISQGAPLGALCVNSEHKNQKFNEENLALLDQLGKIASVALERNYGETKN